MVSNIEIMLCSEINKIKDTIAIQMADLARHEKALESLSKCGGSLISADDVIPYPRKANKKSNGDVTVNGESNGMKMPTIAEVDAEINGPTVRSIILEALYTGPKTKKELMTAIEAARPSTTSMTVSNVLNLMRKSGKVVRDLESKSWEAVY